MSKYSRDKKRPDLPILAIVLPCYNEEEVFNDSLKLLIRLVDDLCSSGQCSKQSFLVFVDDGSSDDTYNLIKDTVKRFPYRVRGIRLTRNFGHQAALLAGMKYVHDKCDVVVTVDVDLQDDISVIGDMIAKYKDGSEIVLGVRRMRETDSAFKRFTALFYYKLMRFLGADIVVNHADFRLMSARVVNLLLENFHEYHLFLRAMVMMLHDKIEKVYYDRTPRLAGESKYNLRKMLSLGWNGVTSYSIVPLRMVMAVGFVICIFSILLSIYALIGVIIGHAVPGWASITIPMYLLGGLIMISLGVVGEYIGKIFIQVKHRPIFLVDEIME